jgi:hypothetical protein
MGYERKKWNWGELNYKFNDVISDCYSITYKVHSVVILTYLVYMCKHLCKHFIFVL